MTDLSGSERFPDDTGEQAARSGPLRLLSRWWPALIGMAAGVVSLLTVEPWTRTDPPTLLLPGLAIAYLVFGAVRGRLRRPGVLRLEIVGLVVFGGCALLAVLVDPRAGQYVAGLAWIGHAAWDVAHHRDLSRHHAVGVVPRGYAEFCIVLDLLIGASLIAAPLA
ncbi:hypothetical protein FHX44_116222 [Pseudonocardia hierapolitana]|uniref:Uncharacterized protein n=1 Tax=Pseudonocardia hierapolitana TaxID=1128676 RepID=A0A561SZJ0_9PSEU|nr:hypothetical protein [Pseudonocardia hierapolitana]TWF80279.1 hypothetical protein FHX44_116222 [Pseudonocardia hierapolitana]